MSHTCTMLPDGTLSFTTLTQKQPLNDGDPALDAVNGVATRGCPPCKQSQIGVPMPYRLLNKSQQPQTRVAMEQTGLSTAQAVNLGLIPLSTPTFKAYPYNHATTVTNRNTGFPTKLSTALQCPNTLMY